MAFRLQMKLGVVPEQDRLPDSPDTVVVVEPTVGAIARSKGHLYLLVASTISGDRIREATQLAADTIRNEYYYDESAGIRVCLEKAIVAANRRLAHIRDRAGLVADVRGAGPVGVAVAVVRGNELYVATVGPAEAYLIRGARLSTLPDPDRHRGLPADELMPDVWRGEISVGDSLVLISPNVMATLGPDELKDAMVTLHPQSAIEHLHHRFLGAGGTGSDGAIALEATEVSVTQRGRTLVPVRAPEPLAGTPDHGPIPLADSVTDGVAAVQESARQVRDMAGGAMGRLVHRLHDLLPTRRPAYRRVTPMSARRETQQRAAIAILAFIVVAGGLGLGVTMFTGLRSNQGALQTAAVGQRALDLARADLERVTGPGIDLIANDPQNALKLLKDALTQLKAAEGAGLPTSSTAPLRTRVVAGLDRLFAVVDVKDSVLYTFPTSVAVDLRAAIRGPDGAPYVLDAGTKSVWRIDLRAKKASAVIRSGQQAAGATAADPKLIATGGPDLLILDAKNVLWRWRPSNATGAGTLRRVSPVKGSSGWGSDIRGLGTYLRNADTGLYNLYVIDPSEQQILAYSPAIDGGGFPADPIGKLATARDVSKMGSLYIDGDIFVVDDGKIERFVNGQSGGWDAADPADEILRPNPGAQSPLPAYALITSGSDRRSGSIYAWDPVNRRVVGFGKSDGRYTQQYRLAQPGTGAAPGASPGASGVPASTIPSPTVKATARATAGPAKSPVASPSPTPGPTATWADIRGWYIIPGLSGAPDTLIWVSATTIHSVVLEATVAGPTGSPGPSSSIKPGGTTRPSPSIGPAP
jgi:hypothetical protein